MSNYVERLHSSLDVVGASNICSHAELEALVDDELGAHPFLATLTLAGLEELLPDYLGMSQGFRYVIAAAQKDAFFEAISESRGVSPRVEMMNSVANFLMWDETGGMDLAAAGKDKLPELLGLRGLHSELLREDAKKLLGHDISPRFTPVTQRYLRELYAGLASTDEVVRCAHMVAFELHAGAMIDSLWASLSPLTSLPREELAYFALHVGGDDPAEVYHVAMTQRMIAEVVPAARAEQFRTAFLDAYRLHVRWCQALVDCALEVEDRSDAERWHHGSCHCGGISFRVSAPAHLDAVRCNCSICDMSGFISLIVPAEKFELLTGAELLSTYRFNTNHAQHTFCQTCGLKPFYRPRSHPEGVSINLRCLDRSTVLGVEVREFDGQNWEASIGELVA